MKEKIKGKVTMDARVTALAIQPEEIHIVKVSVAGHEKPRQFNHVITTLPFGCLRNVDTSACFFSWDLQTAIRSLRYECSTKVAVQFSSRWWEQDNLKQCGGVSSTDRPIRKVIYPSYGMNKNEGATIIVSYTWSQDAARMGSFVQGHNSPEEKLLVDLIIGDLAVMHSLDKEYLCGLIVDYHAYDWSHEPNSAGDSSPFQRENKLFMFNRRFFFFWTKPIFNSIPTRSAAGGWDTSFCWRSDKCTPCVRAFL